MGKLHSSHYHHYADLSEGVEHKKCLTGTFCRVCVFSVPIYVMMMVGICVHQQ